LWAEDLDKDLLRKRMTVTLNFSCGKIEVNDVFGKKAYYIEGLDGSAAISKSVLERTIETSPER
jgi:hypothetical protein